MINSFTSDFSSRLIRFGIEKTAKNFIAGSNIKEIQKIIEKFRKKRLNYTLDILGEASLSEIEAELYANHYQKIIGLLNPENANVSIKLSSLYSRFDPIDSKGTKKAVFARLEKIFEEDCRVWLDGVELSLAEYAENDLLPARILLCGGGSALPGIKKILASQIWLKNLSFLQPKDVVNIEDATGLLRDPQDITPMGLANLALELVGEEKVLSAMLRRAVKMMQN